MECCTIVITSWDLFTFIMSTAFVKCTITSAGEYVAPLSIPIIERKFVECLGDDVSKEFLNALDYKTAYNDGRKPIASLYEEPQLLSINGFKVYMLSAKQWKCSECGNSMKTNRITHGCISCRKANSLIAPESGEDELEICEWCGDYLEAGTDFDGLVATFHCACKYEIITRYNTSKNITQAYIRYKWIYTTLSSSLYTGVIFKKRTNIFKDMSIISMCIPYLTAQEAWTLYKTEDQSLQRVLANKCYGAYHITESKAPVCDPIITIDSKNRCWKSSIDGIPLIEKDLFDYFINGTGASTLQFSDPFTMKYLERINYSTAYTDNRIPLASVYNKPKLVKFLGTMFFVLSAKSWTCKICRTVSYDNNITHKCMTCRTNIYVEKWRNIIHLIGGASQICKWCGGLSGKDLNNDTNCACKFMCTTRFVDGKIVPYFRLGNTKH